MESPYFSDSAASGAPASFRDDTLVSRCAGGDVSIALRGLCAGTVVRGRIGIHSTHSCAAGEVTRMLRFDAGVLPCSQKKYLRSQFRLGKFRTFLLTSLTHFMSNEDDKSRAQRRVEAERRFAG